MSEKTQRLEIVTPQRVVYKDDARFVVVPGVEGELGFLPDHAPLVSALKTGVLRVQKDGNTTSVALHGGFVEVRDSRVTVLANAAEKADEIDKARAEQAKKRAEERLEKKSEDIDVQRAEAALRRALTRLKVAG